MLIRPFGSLCRKENLFTIFVEQFRVKYATTVSGFFSKSRPGVLCSQPHAISRDTDSRMIYIEVYDQRRSTVYPLPCTFALEKREDGRISLCSLLCSSLKQRTNQLGNDAHFGKRKPTTSSSNTHPSSSRSFLTTSYHPNILHVQQHTRSTCLTAE